MKKNGDNIQNFYESKEIKKYITKYHNPKFADTQISVPARIGVIAASGGGKTQFLMNFIAKSSDTFGKIIVVYKASEPLYEYLRDKIGSKNIDFYTSLSKLPPPNELNLGSKQILLVFDDQNSVKDQSKIEEYFLRGRKVAGGITCFYLAQNYFSIPPLIRRQFTYVVILKMSGSKDLKQIIQNYSLGLDANEIIKLYKDATKERFHFLKIDTETRSENKRFSKDFTGFYKISDESESDED
jgi:hypothetical protein